MTDAAARQATGWWRTLVFAVVVGTLAVGAALMMFSAFMFYDDEGYVLISLRNFAEHGALYRDVYSQYGPFPFVFYYALHSLGWPLTHVGGRLITIAAWTGAAICCGLIVHQATRKFVLTLAVIAAAFPYLWIMVSEPSHPGGLICIGVALAAALGHRWLLQQQTQAWAWLVGASAAVLALTKINVGGFVVLSALAWFAFYHTDPRVRRAAPWLAGVGAIAVPVFLMRPMLAMGWVQTFALVVASAGVAAAMAIPPATSPRAKWSTLGWCVAAGAAVASAVLAVVLLRGSSPHDVLEGILLGPLKHPVAFNLRYTWPAGAREFALVSLSACGAATYARHRGSSSIHVAVAVGRLVTAAGVGYAVWKFPDASPDRIVFGYGAPCLWLLVWPLPGEDSTAIAARMWLGLLWVGQYLHAFPVAGSQIAWGTFLLIPLAAIAAHDAASWLRQRAGEPVTTTTVPWRFVAPALLTALTVTVGYRFLQVGGRYRQGSDLGLPGAELLRLPTESTALFRLLSLNATAHGDLLFSEPGMFSFNLWSGLPTPTLANVTHWFSLLSATQQAAIVRALEAHPRTCVIVQRDHINFLTRRSFAPAGPLHEYVTQNFTPAFVLDDFEFCVRNGHHIDPLLLGDMVVESNAADRANTCLKLRILLPRDRPVARIELSSPKAPENPPLVFEAVNAQVEVTPTDLRGRPTGPARPATWPLAADGVVTLAIHFDRFKLPRPVAGGLITFRAADGSEVALARLKQ